MVVLRIDGFAGERRIVDARLLPPNEAVEAVNVDLRHGTLAGIPWPWLEHSFASPPARVIPVYRPDGTREWLTFGSAAVMLAQSPVVNDAYERVYWTDPAGPPKYSTIDDVLNGVAPFDLGVVPPSSPLTVTPSGGSSGVYETRAYVVTLVTVYGEESAPSPPVVVDGQTDDTWAISNIPTTYSGASAAIDKVRIYRTVSGTDTAAFRFVAELAFGTATYSDTDKTSEVALNEPLRTTGWAPPLPNLDGLVRHPAGFLAAFEGRNVYFSEPYQPHAWPAAYTYTLPWPVRALAVAGDVLLAFTEGVPIVLYGSDPAQIGQYWLAASVAAPSPRAVVTVRDFAVAATSDGLVAVAPRSMTRLTAPYYDERQWSEWYSDDIRLAVSGDSVLVRFDESSALLFSLSSTERSGVTMLETIGNQDIVFDPATGDAFLLAGSGLYRFDHPDAPRDSWRWRSKVFQMPKPTNFGALQVKFTSGLHTVTTLPPEAQQYNQQRFDLPPLDVLDGYPLGGEMQSLSVVTGSVPPTQPLGGEPLYMLDAPLVCPVTVRIFGDGDEKAYLCIEDGLTVRLPYGFKATFWQVELAGAASTEVYSVALGTTGRELARA